MVAVAQRFELDEEPVPVASLYDISLAVGQQVIAAILTYPELLDAAPTLEIDDFASWKQRAVWTAIRNNVARHRPLTIDAIHEALVAIDVVRDSVLRLLAGDEYLRALIDSDMTPDLARDAGHVAAWATLLRRIREERERG